MLLLTDKLMVMILAFHLEMSFRLLWMDNKLTFYANLL